MDAERVNFTPITTYDLIQNGWRISSMRSNFSSHLFGGVPVLLHSIYWWDEDHLLEYWTRPNVPGPRLNHLPICLLIGNDTFTAGEQFASDLKAHQRAVLIGETTGGGAHPDASYR